MDTQNTTFTLRTEPRPTGLYVPAVPQSRKTLGNRAFDFSPQVGVIRRYYR